MQHLVEPILLAVVLTMVTIHPICVLFKLVETRSIMTLLSLFSFGGMFSLGIFLNKLNIPIDLKNYLIVISGMGFIIGNTWSHITLNKRRTSGF